MQIETRTLLNEAGELRGEAPLSDEEALKAFKLMLKTRMIDERMILLQRQGRISFALSSLGEEASAVGAALALQKEDWIYPQYRESGAAFARGMTTLQFLHQMFGTEKDSGKGRQMPNHFGSRELSIVTVSSPIATQIPHAAGAAYAMKMKREKRVSLVFFGEGATSEGDFHAGMNFAAVLSCPCIFFCRNNGYAISTGVESQFHSAGIAPKGEGYGVKAVRVDGNDLFAVYAAVKEAREQAFLKGPTLIEAMTYRMGAHSTSDDPTRYRPKEEVELWKKRDPLKRLGSYLKISPEREQEIRSEIKREIDEALAVVEKTPRPARHTLVEDVYAEVPKRLEEELKWLS